MGHSLDAIIQSSASELHVILKTEKIEKPDRPPEVSVIAQNEHMEPT
jgi:hypothetical protein